MQIISLAMVTVITTGTTALLMVAYVFVFLFSFYGATVLAKITSLNLL